MSRNPFSFLDSESPERRILLLLLAILHKQGDSITLTLSDLTAIEDGASFHKYPDDTSTSLVLRFARRGAEAVFLRPGEADLSTTTPRRPARSIPSIEEPPPRHAIHDDIDLALREEEMAQRAKAQAAERLRQARVEAGAMPWRTRQ